MKIGRAKNLPGGVRNTGFEQKKNKRIEILDKNHKPLCPQYQTYKLIDSEQILICCDMYLNCLGNLLTYSLGAYEYVVEDNEKYAVCNVFNDDIYSAILKYNEGKTDCLSLFKLEIESLYKNPLRDLGDKLFTLLHKTEDNSDIVIIYKCSNWINLDKFNAKAAMNPTIIDDFIAKAEAKDYTQ